MSEGGCVRPWECGERMPQDQNTDAVQPQSKPGIVKSHFLIEILKIHTSIQNSCYIKCSSKQSSIIHKLCVQHKSIN